MKFYDIDVLENKCGIDNKYKVTALVAARARWLSEQKTILDARPENEKYLTMALLEIEEEKLPSEWAAELWKTPFSPNSPKNARTKTKGSR
jgi:DNA-directed RNA polymerase subunit K/omega